MFARASLPLLLLALVGLLAPGCPNGAATITVTPQDLDFGEVAVGETATLTVVLANEGDAASVVSFVVSGDGPFEVALSGAISVEPGDSRTVFVEASPTVEGEASGELQVAWSESQVSVGLSVTGVGGGADEDGDGYTSDVDCDDTNPEVNPGATEVCNGLDDDCQGGIDEDFDADDDGVTTCGDDGTPLTADDDCDDGNDAVFPGATETCDGLDEDCDGEVDEGFDADGDGVTSCAGDCDDGNDAINPSATEACNGLDDDCDAEVDEGFDDVDGDGEAFCTDCDDTDPTAAHGLPELCDGADNDCNGLVDDGFPDVDGDGYDTCTDCDDAEASANPGATEVCDGIVDNDCDGTADPLEVDDDGDSVTECDGDCDDADAALNPLDADGDGVSTCDATPDCDDGDANNFPGNTELCDGVDNDCDGSPEDSGDVDGDGFSVCVGDCDDSDPTIFPGAVETCDGIDQDCDGAPDNGFTDGDADGVAGCIDCDDADPTAFPGNPEVCDAVDNDCDSDVDEDFDVDGDSYFDEDDAGCVTAYGANVDCDDAEATVFPGAADVCDAFVDNDCDGTADPLESDDDVDGATECEGDCDDTDAALNVADVDGDGVTTCDANPDCDDTVATIFPGATEVCDGIDQDCDTDVDEDFDVDADTYFDGNDAGCVTTYGVNADCDDGSADVYPGALDVCDAYLDNDCDGQTDPLEADDDGDGDSECGGDCDDTNAALSVADVDGDGSTTCDVTPDCDDNDGDYFPGATEVCSDPDFDCDGTTEACLTCDDALAADPTRAGADGVYSIDPDGVGVGDPAFDAWCDMTTDGGGWTAIMRSTDDGVDNANLVTTYADFYGTNVGSASTGAYRVAGKHWETLSDNGDVADEIMVTHTLVESSNGQACAPISYILTGPNTLTVPPGGSATYGYIGPDTYSIVNGSAASAGVQIASFSALDNGPWAAGCVSTYNTAPWFYDSAFCGNLFPTVDSIYPSPLPTVRINRVEASDVTAACSSTPSVTAINWYDEAEQVIFLR